MNSVDIGEDAGDVLLLANDRQAVASANDRGALAEHGQNTKVSIVDFTNAFVAKMTVSLMCRQQEPMRGRPGTAV